MQKVVVDTCVLISGFAYGGIPAKAVELAFSDFQIIVSPKLLNEYKKVPLELYKKNKINFEQLSSLVRGIASFVKNSIFVIPKKTLKICRDPADDMLLECCLEVRAHFLVSSDKDLLSISGEKLENKLHHLQILKPGDFLRKFSKTTKLH
ncbi:MAG: putative toxin-antitoxin system toxin component, PIN family [Deltaproteobacteria bacterium]|nr:putative toxin-antitoxin system toxin component, PIN family [Deltaproteobacteria bacterium]